MIVVTTGSYTWKSFKKLHEYLVGNNYDIVEELSHILIEGVEANEIVIYVNSLKNLRDEDRRIIKAFVRRGARLIAEIVPGSRRDVYNINKLVGSYGIEVTWIKAYDPINNNGVALNPKARLTINEHEGSTEVIVEHAYHVRIIKAKPLLVGYDTALAMNPETNEVVPYPRGGSIVYAAIHVDQLNGNLVTYMAGYVFRDTIFDYNRGLARLLFGKTMTLNINEIQ